MLKSTGADLSAGRVTGSKSDLVIDGRRYLSKGLWDTASKRAFDMIVSGLGMIVALPLFAAIAVLIKLDSRGPVFYKQTRVGRHRRPFKIWKFRKMYEDLPTQGPSLTMRYDFRMTRFGRILERTKLDELPQLINVLRGEMSAIGPRPEVPKFVEHYPDQWQHVLSVKPGIFGPNQLKNRNESELYPPGCADVEAFYVNHILPDKLEIDAQYGRKAGLVEDLWILMRCLVVATFGAITWRTIVTMRQQLLNFAVLTAAGIGGMAAAHLLAGRNLSDRASLEALILASIVKPLCLLIHRIPKSLAMSVTAEDFLGLVRCALASAAVIAFAMFALGHAQAEGLVLALDTALFLGVLLIFKLTLYSAYLTFRVQDSRVVERRMLGAALVMGPVSAALAATQFTSTGAWAADRMALALMFLAILTRPAMVLLMGSARTGGSWIAQAWAMQRRLVFVTLSGSCLMALGVVLLGQAPVGRGVVMLDALIFHLGMTAFATWQILSAARAAESGDAEVGDARERILVVGSGIELGNYVGALAVLPEPHYEIVGVVTPHDRFRTSTVGGHAVLGELSDVPDILKTLRVNRLVVLPNGIQRASLTMLQKSALEMGCQYISAPMLSGLLSKGGSEARDGGVRVGPPPHPITGGKPPARPERE